MPLRWGPLSWRTASSWRPSPAAGALGSLRLSGLCVALCCRGARAPCRPTIAWSISTADLHLFVPVPPCSAIDGIPRANAIEYYSQRATGGCRSSGPCSAAGAAVACRCLRFACPQDKPPPAPAVQLRTQALTCPAALFLPRLLPLRRRAHHRRGDLHLEHCPRVSKHAGH